MSAASQWWRSSYPRTVSLGAIGWFTSTFSCLNEEPLDTSDKGYQPPLDESLVKEVDPEDFM